MRVPSWPVDRKHLKELDAHLRTKFCREDYDKALNADKKLGIEPNFYNGLDMQASRAQLNALYSKRKIDATVPNRESGLGKMNAMEQKIPKHEQSISIMESRVSISEKITNESILLDDVNMLILSNTILTVILPTLETRISEQVASRHVFNGKLKECFQSSLLIGPVEQPNRSKRC